MQLGISAISVHFLPSKMKSLSDTSDTMAGLFIIFGQQKHTDVIIQALLPCSEPLFRRMFEVYLGRE
jgi:hypothetical protein